MFDGDYGQHSGAPSDSGYAEAKSTSGVEGGGNAQKTSSQSGNYNDRASNYGDAGGPGGYNEARYCQTSSGSYGDAGGQGDNNDLSKPSSSRYTPYEITSRGTNDQGNRYDTRIQPSGPAYHYSNQDGSYYYKNGDNSTYHNDGQGGATYTTPDGKVYKK